MYILKNIFSNKLFNKRFFTKAKLENPENFGFKTG